MSCARCYNIECSNKTESITQNKMYN